MTNIERLRELILSLKGEMYETSTDLAKKTGVPQSVLYEFLERKRKPQIAFETIWRVLDYLGFSFPTLTQRNVKEGTEMQAVAVYDVAGAGPGVEISELEPVSLVQASPAYLRQADFAVLVNGHSMEPKIPHGSVVGVKVNSDFRANDIYVARIPYEGLVVKHVTVDRETNEFVFHSYNPNRELYPDFRVKITESSEIIVGRVVWITIPN